MEKTIEQIKEEVARENNCSSYNQFLDKLVWSSEFELMEKWNNVITIRYAQQFQSPTDTLVTEVCVLRERVSELEDWKESAMNVFSNLQLQELGKVLDIKLGEDIAINVLPKVKCLIERVEELEELLIGISKSIEKGERIGGVNLLTTNSVEYDSIKRLINKSK